MTKKGWSGGGKKGLSLWGVEIICPKILNWLSASLAAAIFFIIPFSLYDYWLLPVRRSQTHITYQHSRPANSRGKFPQTASAAWTRPHSWTKRAQHRESRPNSTVPMLRSAHWPASWHLTCSCLSALSAACLWLLPVNRIIVTNFRSKPSLRIRSAEVYFWVLRALAECPVRRAE